MKREIKELVFILDKSGSMSGKEEDTIGSFNTTISNQRKNDYKVLVTTVLFSDNSKIIHDREDIDKIGKLTANEYQVGGSTALIDAIGEAISHIKTIRKYIRKEDVPSKTAFVIVTDGLENASKKYSSDEVKKMVEECKEKGFEFIFMGANIDAVETAKKFSIDESRTVNFINDRVGIKKAHRFANRMCEMAFSCEKIDENAVNEIRKEVVEDYNARIR